MNSRVEQTAETIKARLQIGSRLEVAISILKENGFTCQMLNERPEEHSQPSLLCQKRVVEKRWWGMADYHHVRVLVAVNTSNIITSADVAIIWGGLRGLRGEVTQI